MATKKAKGLGRGLDALFESTMSLATSHIQDAQQNMLAIETLQAGKYQPRKQMDEGSLMELAASIKAQGVMQPILVRPIKSQVGKNKFEIIAGERRFKASQLAGLKEVPVLIKEVNDQTAAAMALIENIQREDLNPLEEAQGLQRLIHDFHFTHEQTAEAIGRSRSAVTNLLRLLNLAHPVQQMLMNKEIEMGHARALLTVDGATQIQLANKIAAKKLTVREVEKLVAQQAEMPKKKSTVLSKKSRDIKQLEEELSDLLATSVVLNMTTKGSGQLVIHFSQLDTLENVLDKLRSPAFA